MFKIFFILTILGISLFAQCKGWVSRTAPQAYCWDIEYIKSPSAGKEYTINKHTTTKNHSGLKSNYTIEAMINVYGYPQKKPKILLNYRYGKLVSKKDVKNRLGEINYTKYLFSIPQNSIDIKGLLEVKDFNKLKKTLYIK